MRPEPLLFAEVAETCSVAAVDACAAAGNVLAPVDPLVRLASCVDAEVPDLLELLELLEELLKLESVSFIEMS
jgi:hypothetical protein